MLSEKNQTFSIRMLIRSGWLLFSFLLFMLILPGQNLHAQENNANKINYTHSHLNPGDALMLVGYFDDIHYIQLYLQRDDDLWEGHVLYPDDSLSFNLEGGWTGDTDMLLLEFNDDGERSGLWQIAKEDDHYKALWSNKSQSVQIETILYDDLWTPDFKKDYYKQITDFQVKVEKSEVQLSILENRSGVKQITVKNPKTKAVIQSELVCLNKSCTDFELKFNQFNGYGKSSLNGTIHKNTLTGFFTTEKDKVLAISPSMTAIRETRLQTELNELYSITVEYPVLTGLNMPIFIQNKVDTMIMEIKKDLKENGPPETDQAVAERQKMFAFAWFEIFFWDNQMISGKWTVQKSWASAASSHTFNYDLEEELPVNFPDQFKNDFDYRFFIDKYKKSESQKLLETKDLLLKNKVSQCVFPNLNFDENGLVYTSDFDTIFGELEIVIPASELVEQLKNKSKLKKIFVK